MNPIRYALVRPKGSPEERAAIVERYLPSNYKVLWTGEEGVVVAGRDDHGWTLHGYVIPRLESGLMWAEEIDLSHEVMLKVPDNESDIEYPDYP